MPTQTSMLHVRIDDELKTQAAETLAKFGLTVSDAVRILLTRVAKEGALPAGFTSDAEAYDKWFRAKVREAMEDTGPKTSHEDVMAEATTLLRRKRGADS
ncbi:DNA-damage-inducible protein J [Pseudomonas sp. NFACC02]|uniref:type II toxin-antitoxin system RelB family antitoxin n=2 Tax=Pseudomonas TaxID=286 RepID=UPI0007834F09|nr:MULTISPECIES: type II toxin-antitoxin system RelB/DinJ family antitoxin [Pseudomonas]SEQ56301.1 DNA-damage-inducible protein J [Pseudomonas sp. NFACC02]